VDDESIIMIKPSYDKNIIFRWRKGMMDDSSIIGVWDDVFIIMILLSLVGALIKVSE
jgi:hypothetical protein